MTTRNFYSAAAHAAKYGAIMFDLDGTLTPSEDWWPKIETAHLKHYGIEVTPALIAELTQHLMGISIHQGARWLQHRFNLDCSVHQIVERRIAVASQFYRDMPLLKGARELLKTFSHFKTALVSSLSLALIEILVDRHGLRELFDAIVSGDHIRRAKPEPDIFLLAASILGIRPKYSLVFEDSPNGLESVKRAGMMCCLIPNPSAVFDRSFKPDFEFSRLTDIDFVKLRRALVH